MPKRPRGKRKRKTQKGKKAPSPTEHQPPCAGSTVHRALPTAPTRRRPRRAIYIPRTARIPPPPHRTRPGRLLFSSVRSPTRRPHRCPARSLASPPRSSPPSPLARARHLASSLHVARAQLLYKVRLPLLPKLLCSRLWKVVEASDKCQREKRKTINGDDLLWAMATLGFEDYIEPLKVYLQKYREGDSKLTAKAGDGSIKKDALGHGGASSSGPQGMSQQGVYNQGMGYMQPQYHNGDISN
ncbi:hypothetical protein EJB05_35897, partial [Eragrostis curvula]